MDTNVVELPLSHKAWAWFEKNRNQALMGTAGIFILGIIIFFFAWQREQKQVRAGQALSNVAARQPVTASGKQENPQDYLKVAADYPSSKAAARALLLAAGALFNEGKYPDAQAQFEKFTREYRESPLLGEALIGVASCLEAQGKVDQAVTAYKDLITRHPGDSVTPQAKFSLGGLYEKQKRPELARDMYEQVERDSRFSILGSEAGMRLEELAQKNPNLAPAPPVPGSSPTPVIQIPTPSAGSTNIQVETVPSTKK